MDSADESPDKFPSYDPADNDPNEWIDVAANLIVRADDVSGVIWFSDSKELRVYLRNGSIVECITPDKDYYTLLKRALRERHHG